MGEPSHATFTLKTPRSSAVLESCNPPNETSSFLTFPAGVNADGARPPSVSELFAWLALPAAAASDAKAEDGTWPSDDSLMSAPVRESLATFAEPTALCAM